jgi:hypothetical protein
MPPHAGRKVRQGRTRGEFTDSRRGLAPADGSAQQSLNPELPRSAGLCAGIHFLDSRADRLGSLNPSPHFSQRDYIEGCKPR